MTFRTSLLIPTYCRAEMLEFFFESLGENGIRPDMILFIRKPCPILEKDSINTIKKYNKYYKIYVVDYHGPFGVIKQYILGLRILYKLGFDIAIFLDDDIYIPFKNFIELHERWYISNKIGGVNGYIINSIRIDNKYIPISEYIERPYPLQYKLFRSALSKRFLQTYASKGGYVLDFGNDLYYISNGFKQITSLLSNGGNMSVRVSALEELLRMPYPLPNIKRGLGYEALLSYYLLKNNYFVIKDYSIKVYHILAHRSTKMRNIKFEQGIARSYTLSHYASLVAEKEFTFYHLKYLYPKDFKYFNKFIEYILYNIYNLFKEINPHVRKKSKHSLFIGYMPFRAILARLLGSIYGNAVGIYYLLSQNKDNIYNLFDNFERQIKSLLG